MKVYTRSGDKGETSITATARLQKDDPTVRVLGILDALLVALDKCELYQRTQHLQEAHTNLSLFAGEFVGTRKTATIQQLHIDDLEREMDDLNLTIPPTTVRFVTQAACAFSEARVICRELERHLTPFLRKNAIRAEEYAYINRLSDHLFCLAFSANNSE